MLNRKPVVDALDTVTTLMTNDMTLPEAVVVMMSLLLDVAAERDGFFAACWEPMAHENEVMLRRARENRPKCASGVC